jgi:2-C-methyl-D-erythritol 4-phosphate cytidylyltransferase
MIKNNILAIIPAAGIGSRFLSNMPKQYSSINETNIIQKTVSTFIHSSTISKIIIPVNKNDQYIKEQEFYKDPKIKVIQGGDTRAKSVLNALNCIDIKDYDYVLTQGLTLKAMMLI